MELPKSLLDQIQEGNVVLFLGAGASYGAIHDENKKIPLGSDLANMIADKFLGKNFLNQPLSYVSELAISETDLFTVQKFIAEYFEKFKPAKHHELIPKFQWKSIFTTNYDLIIERVYQKKGIQDLSTVIKNTNQKDIFHSEKSLPYYKLHGCISNINDNQIPLILTPEQYINHKNGRERLFSRLKELAHDFTFLFVGFGFSDMDIRAVYQEIEATIESKPRSYMVGPHISDIDMRFWESKKITGIKMSFDRFLYDLDDSISSNNRILAALKPQIDYPIYKKFTVNIDNIKPTEGFITFLNQDIDFLHKAFPTEKTDAKAFYKGYFENWNPIAVNLDVRRNITDGIISEVFLNDDYGDSNSPFLFLIKGFAGSGKSVLLKRIAWDTANSFDKLSVFLKSGAKLKFEPFAELHNYVKERIFLFIDGISGKEDEIKNFMYRAKRDNLPISIICTERTNIWNTDCRDLEKFVTESYEIKYLNDKEIDHLIQLLERHNSLGTLKSKTEIEKKSAFSERAGRELLVALYEATSGKPFEEIIYDEYMTINSEAAKSLYLTVSILHRLGAAARAGLISRIHNISFIEFRDRLFRPLESIVFDRKDYQINDYIYLTRHKQIADIVFEKVLTDEQARFDEYYRLLQNLNIDYESDRLAYIAMINARKLQSIFNNPQNSRKLFDLAQKNNPEDAKVLQQRAIFEMNNSGGSTYTAQRYLDLAHKKAPYDAIISHSYAELAYIKAEESPNPLERDKYINETIDICERLIKKNPETSHAFHTLIKAQILRLKKSFKESDIPAIERLLKDIEKLFNTAKQKFVEDQYILEIEASFNELIDNTEEANIILKKAFDSNQNSPFIAIRYSQSLKNNDKEGALDVLKRALQATPGDKDLNYTYGKILIDLGSENYNDILHYLRRSFIIGDSRHEAQFWYARTLYLNNEISEAKKIFHELSRININPSIKKAPKGIIKINGKNHKFNGTIKNKEFSYGFLTRDTISDDIFFNIDKTNPLFERGDRVKFNLAFTYKGAIAINLEQSKN